MKKIAVLGGAGFIGSHIVEKAIANQLEVVVLDNITSGFQHNIQVFIDKNQAHFIKGDIADIPTLKAALYGVDTVFHLAALTSVPESIEFPEKYIHTNTLGTYHVLKTCEECGVKNLVFSSSAAIYGDNPLVPKVESMRAEPKSMYAVTKLDGEMYCQLFREHHNLNATALRYFNVFGPRQDPNSAYAAAIPIFIAKALANQPITIFGDGEQTRDFVYVKDVVQANFLAANQGTDVVNVAYGEKITINALAKKIIAFTKSKSHIQYLDPRPGDIKHSVADNQKIIREIGFKPISNLDEGLQDTIAYFKDKI